MKKIFFAGVFLILISFLISCAPAEPLAGEAILQKQSTIQDDLISLEKSHQSYREAAEKLSDIYYEFDEKVKLITKSSALANTKSVDPAELAQLLESIKDLQETQALFNLEYLQLQESMRIKDTQFTTISNIMKSKYNTTSNIIKNIR